MRSPVTTGTFKLGINRGRPRVWLDGRPLAAAGFTPGTVYSLEARPGLLVLRLDRDMGLLEGLRRTPTHVWEERKVSGRPDGKAIIDVTGGVIRVAFPGELPARILAVFEPGQITIRAAEAPGNG